MRIVLFYHSLISDWNHGNAHFLRGIVTELLVRKHEVRVYEPSRGWSLRNLVAASGLEAVRDFHKAFPHLRSRFYKAAEIDLDAALDGADLVIVHEWNEPEIIARIGRHRRQSRYQLLFHDTHHRSVTDPASIDRYPLADYDGVLAFGEVIRDLYVRKGWTRRAWTWHEAADVRLFKPILTAEPEGDVVWIGNWGDGERTAALHQFLIDPIREWKLRAGFYGVRYPDEVCRELAENGIAYGGWLPNYHVPQTLARYRMTAHIPRRPYTEILHGVPTIRVFEALACGIPLACSRWNDTEKLFTPGRDFLMASDPAEMSRHIREIVNDRSTADEIATNGLCTIRRRHTCAHRVDELLWIYAGLTGRQSEHILTGTPQ